MSNMENDSTALNSKCDVSEADHFLHVGDITDYDLAYTNIYASKLYGGYNMVWLNALRPHGDFIKPNYLVGQCVIV